ncbi:MAG: phosphohistidine phosphatase SixA [Candidatus Omnitrophica bacterium]|nr:phosphohistidine phosphatase SixA [Candidatus Omnitrophota bacterium]
MRLYLIRHAEAVPRGTPGYAQDSRRPLTEQGHEQARDISLGLKRLQIVPDVLLTSPYVRAMQTANYLAQALQLSAPPRELSQLRAEAEPAETSTALAPYAQQEHVMLVGHEPHLSAWIAELTAGSGGMRCQMKKAGAACIDIERVPPPSGSGTLRWLLSPKQLALIAKSS